MSNTLLYHSVGIKDFDHVRYSRTSGVIEETITRQRDKFYCSACHSHSVTATRVGARRIKAPRLGTLEWILIVESHRVRCHDCGAYLMEELPFISHPKARMTRSLERTILNLRAEMSISAISNYFNLDWRIVKDIEKNYLEKKYGFVSLKDVNIIGIDDIYIGKKKYKTIVRDLSSGSVLHVGDGKGGDALTDFGKRLKFSKAKIEIVAMDMSSGYASWVKEALPGAEIVFDHFHIIKLMNDKVDKIRRRIMNQLEGDELKLLKKTFFNS